MRKESDRTSAGASSPDVDVPGASPLSILVVDDGARTPALVERLNREVRLEVRGVARDGVEALRLLGRRPVDLVLMGTVMPRMDGLTTLRLLRKSHQTPVVVIGSSRDVEIMLDALALGAVGYFEWDAVRWAREDVADFLRSLAVDPDEDVRLTSLCATSGGLDAQALIVPPGRIRGLSATLKDFDPRGGGIYVLTDAPAWLLDPLARRLHQSTPWRVLVGDEDDVLAPGHALLVNGRDGLVPETDGGHVRLVRRDGCRVVERDGSIEAIPVLSQSNGAHRPTEGRRAA